MKASYPTVFLQRNTFLCAALVLGCCAAAPALWAQKTPSGDPKDFRIRPCLHSIGYAGLWRGQAQLTVDEFLVKAKALGFDSVMIMAKRPHLSPLDYDASARQRLKARLPE